jgi:proteasome lid subunit RPN8/RPN11
MEEFLGEIYRQQNGIHPKENIRIMAGTERRAQYRELRKPANSCSHYHHL